MSSDPTELATQLVGEAETAGIPLRLFGGAAVKLLVQNQKVARACPGDIDCVALSKNLSKLLNLFTSMGFQEDAEVRRLFGRRRRAFVHEATKIKVDLCLDYLEFSATIDVRRSLRSPLKSRPYTLPVSELLLSKLQPKELADKDVQDVINLLATYGPGRRETDTDFCLKQFVRPCARDWGLCRLVLDNLVIVKTTPVGLEAVDLEVVHARINVLIDQIRRHPKSMFWWLRSLFGRGIQYWNDVDINH